MGSKCPLPAPPDAHVLAFILNNWPYLHLNSAFRPTLHFDISLCHYRRQIGLRIVQFGHGLLLCVIDRFTVPIGSMWNIASTLTTL